MKHLWLRSGLTRVFCVIAFLALGLPAARAATIWNTAGSGDKLNWSDANNWNPAGVPGDGAEVVITNGSVLLTNATYNLASLTITGATTRLTFSNWDTKLTATNVIIQSGATITHVTNSALTTNELGEWPTDGRIWIAGCTNLELQTGGQIDAYGRGFLGGLSTNGRGPGGGGLAKNGTTAYAGAGGHGGAGGRGHYYGVGLAGLAYDLTNAPSLPGSGGGGQGLGAGGGVILIDAANGTVTIEGTINANGRNSGGAGGGGAGGSIYITCRVLGGSSNGRLTAMGGIGYYSSVSVCSGHGGGGRIAIDYDEAAQGGQPRPGIRFNVATGVGSYVTPPPVIGTLYLPDESVFTTNLSNFEVVRIFGVTNLSLESLSLTNSVLTNNVIFSAPHFALKVTNTLAIDTAILQVGDPLSEIEYQQIDCGDLQLTSRGTTQSQFYVYSGPTNEVITAYGARVTVAGDIVISSNCWIYPVSNGTNGGSVFFTANNVTINAGGGFDAEGLGYSAGPGQGTNGYGPGGGTSRSSYPHGGGGGYGGKGGNGSSAPAGVAYPWTNAPRCPGSGGGFNGVAGGAGGGLVWIKASGTFVLDGMIKANGKTTTDGYYGGGGSGGGIFIVANKIRGAVSGQLSAYGGSARYSNVNIYGGGGGGGRIALWHRISEADQQAILADPDNALANVPKLVVANDFAGTFFLGSCTASNGWGYAANAETGTVVCLTVPPPKGMIFSIH
ncbi:MAG: hypothetical protein PHW60_11970 [Kiritimatiellae bacterium]|nr:hypothetical protein [Kiritimatiellia bacterium]